MTKTKIEWAEYSWNPWIGCRKTESAGCDNCYMFREQKRFGNDPKNIRKSKTKFDYPLKIRESGKRVFVCSWSDFFLPEADKWRDEAWDIMRQRKDLSYLILTKRPWLIEKNIPKYIDELPVWFGVTIAEISDIEKWSCFWWATKIKTFISFEPLIEPIKIKPHDAIFAPDWIIIGGESGNDARPMKEEWVEHIIKQAQKADIPVFVKQMGNVWAEKNNSDTRKGEDITEWKESLQVREAPDSLKPKGWKERGFKVKEQEE